MEEVVDLGFAGVVEEVFQGLPDVPHGQRGSIDVTEVEDEGSELQQTLLA